jgi:hypothetical protein
MIKDIQKPRLRSRVFDIIKRDNKMTLSILYSKFPKENQDKLRKYFCMFQYIAENSELKYCCYCEKEKPNSDVMVIRVLRDWSLMYACIECIMNYNIPIVFIQLKKFYSKKKKWVNYSDCDMCDYNWIEDCSGKSGCKYETTKHKELSRYISSLKF